ncbi:hypothetical protein ACS0TY_027466 [Phlomoides rotata]
MFIFFQIYQRLLKFFPCRAYPINSVRIAPTLLETGWVFLSFFLILVKKHISILQDVSGIIRPCRTTLLARSSKLRKDNIVVGFGWEVGCCFEGLIGTFLAFVD